jgi:hypothetical protein
MNRRVKSLLYGGLVVVFFAVVLAFGIWLVVNSTKTFLASPRIGGMSEPEIGGLSEPVESSQTVPLLTEQSKTSAPAASLTTKQTETVTIFEPTAETVRNAVATRSVLDERPLPPSREVEAEPAGENNNILDIPEKAPAELTGEPADDQRADVAENTQAAENADVAKEPDEYVEEPDAYVEEPVEYVEEPDEYYEYVEEPSGFIPYQSTGDAELDGYCDEIIDSFYWDGMNDEQLAFEIWYYCIEMNYHNEEYRTDWINVAKETARWYSGNCYGHSSLARALLTRAGISNLQFWQPYGEHSWNMVNFGYGWYHFDTTDRRPNIIFMWTDAELDAYQARLTHPDHVNTYVPRPDGMPLTPEEPYDLSRVYP